MYFSDYIRLYEQDNVKVLGFSQCCSPSESDEKGKKGDGVEDEDIDWV